MNLGGQVEKLLLAGLRPRWQPRSATSRAGAKVFGLHGTWQKSARLPLKIQVPTFGGGAPEPYRLTTGLGSARENT